MRNEDQGSPCFILTPQYALRGWELLPYVVQRLDRPQTEFFRSKEEWTLFASCDGQTRVDWEKLTIEQQNRYLHWLKNGFIRIAKAGERLRPDQQYCFYHARFKEKVHWSITGRCNYKCKHCFMSAPHAAQGEPTWQELMVMLDAFERCGIHNLELTGGEPLVRSDFWQLVDEIHARGMIITTIYTNGLLVTDAFLEQLEKRHMRPAVQFSFDGVGHHDWMRGVTGAEQIAIDAIRRCRQHHLVVSVSMVMCRESIGSIRESVNLLASLGVSSLKIGAASPQGEWKNQPEHFLSQEELYQAFLEYLPHFFEDGKPLTLVLDGFFSYDKVKDATGAIFEKHVEEADFGKTTMCSHVRRGMYVSPKGNVLPCMSMVGSPIEEQFPNMLETPLEQILSRKSAYMEIVGFKIRDYMDRNPECRSCSHRVNCCGGCRALAVQYDPLNYLAKDPVTCAYYRDGWKEKKEAVLRRVLG